MAVAQRKSQKSDKGQNHTEKQEEQSDTTNTESQRRERASKEAEEEKSMADNLTMQVLKDQAGTRDYTSLEELNPEPGSHIAVVVKNAKSRAFGQACKKDGSSVKDLN